MKKHCRRLLLLGLLLSMVPLPQVRAQGCAQCLDSTRANPPAVQSAYRHAILLVGGFGLTIFLGGIVLLRSQR